MKSKLSGVFLCLLLPLCALGQKQAPKPFGPQPVNASTGVYYPLPAEMRAQVRDLQYVNDHLEIEIQQLMLRIEQDREKQAELVNKMKTVAVGYAISKHIDTTQFDFDANEVRFAEKK
jgi:hypothetical protein